MNQKTLLIAGIVVAGLAVIAIAMTSRTDQRTTATSRGSDDFLVPGLIDRLNDVARVEVANKDRRFHLVRDGDQWGLEEKGSYPIVVDTLREMLIKIASLRKAEEKTSNPAFHARLELEDLESEDARSRLVRLYDAEGNELASVILGKTEYQGMEPQQFVRLAGNNQSWLADGNVSMVVSENSWLDREVLNIVASRPQRVTIRHADGEEVRAERREPGQHTFDLLTKPDGREYRTETVTNEFGRILTSMRLDDVRRRSALDLDGGPEVLLEVETFNGLTVRADIYDADDKRFVLFTAEVNDDFVEAENARRTARAEEESAASTGEGDTPPLPQPDLIDADTVREEAQSINDRVGDWAYAFPSYITDRLTRRNDYFLKDPVADGADEQPSEMEGFVPADGMMLGPDDLRMDLDPVWQLDDENEVPVINVEDWPEQ